MQANKESKGTPVPGGALQVVLKGQREVLALQKPPNNVAVTIYKSDSKAKHDEGTNTGKPPKSEIKTNKATDKTDKGAGMTESKNANAKQTSNSNNPVSL